LREQLEKIQSDGYAISHDELQNGVHGVAVPILDRPDHALASLAILTPNMRADRLMSHLDELRGATDRITSSLTMGDGEVANQASAEGI
jgi:IclR family KDG regulon transcriptional repressor